MRQDQMRERLLDASLTLLRTEGHEQVTVRRVTAAAGVNVAAVSTAFGGRSALLDALLSRVLIPVNEERDRRFDALAASATVEDMVRAFVDPLAALGQDSAQVVMSVLTTVALDGGGGRPVDRLLHDPGVRRWADELRRRDVATGDGIDGRVRLAVGTILAACAMSSTTDLSDDAHRERVVQFVAAGLR